MKRLLQGSTCDRKPVLSKCIRRQPELNFVYRAQACAEQSTGREEAKITVFSERNSLRASQGLSTIGGPILAANGTIVISCIRLSLEQLLQQRIHKAPGVARCVRRATHAFNLELRVAMILTFVLQALHSIVCLVIQRPSSEEVRTTSFTNNSARHVLWGFCRRDFRCRVIKHYGKRSITR
jgi:hypothetical protein